MYVEYVVFYKHLYILLVTVSLSFDSVNRPVVNKSIKNMTYNITINSHYNGDRFVSDKCAVLNAVYINLPRRVTVMHFNFLQLSQI